MLSERRKIVLSALIEEYIASAQPVASKCLVERYKVGCSPATVRNDLAVLEETGYVYQPHVSAGRIPTDSGYRVFVDELTASGDRVVLTPAEIEAVHSCYAVLECRIGDLMRETSALLSELTRYVAVVVEPVVQRARIRRIDLVPIATGRALVVVITEKGRVADRLVELPDDVSAEHLRDAEAALNAALEGKRAEDVRGFAHKAFDSASPLARLAAGEVLECLEELEEEHVHSDGTSALLDQPEFADSRTARPLVALLEDGMTLLQALSDAVRAKDVVVRIGSENTAAGLEHVSVVLGRYAAEGGEGLVGVIGPTRMDYTRAIGAVRSVSEALSGALE